jgi:hypothetical protein
MAIRKPSNNAQSNYRQSRDVKLPSGVRQGVENASSPIAQRIMQQYHAAAPGNQAIRDLANDSATPDALRKFLQSVIQS